VANTIYFDEAGYTGNHLMDPDQRFFAYGSVVTSDEEAKEFVESLIRRYNIQNGELKGGKLVSHHKGRKAIDEILREFHGRLLVTVSDKKYTLACKLFEYIFEPSISDINSLFYGVGFHRFIANILYMEFMARGAGAEQIFDEFQDLMRRPDDGKLGALFSASKHPDNSPVITQIREFAQYRAADIKEEVESLAESSVGKWVLDVTNSSLHSLLAHWGTKYDVITAICDNSKPLQESGEFFKIMVGNEQRLKGGFAGNEHPMTFNLSGPLEFRDSKTCHGIQLADAVAGAAVHVLGGGTDDHAKRWRELLPEMSILNILPDKDELDLRLGTARRNVVLLNELHARAKNGQDLIEGMPLLIARLTHRLNLPPIPRPVG